MQDKLQEYEAHIYDMTINHDQDMDAVKTSHKEDIHKMAPLQIKKQWVKNNGGKGGRMEWMPYVDKCIIEMLSNRTQPSCVQANMLVMAKITHPS